MWMAGVNPTPETACASSTFQTMGNFQNSPLIINKPLSQTNKATLIKFK
jgi:hypothetical protein